LFEDGRNPTYAVSGYCLIESPFLCCPDCVVNLFDSSQLFLNLRVAITARWVFERISKIGRQNPAGWGEEEGGEVHRQKGAETEQRFAWMGPHRLPRQVTTDSPIGF
jgi:hypothetical protein